MEYILYSTPVKLRSMEVQVPPISMYQMKRLLLLRESGVDLDNPGSEDMKKILNLVGDMIRENHPELTDETLEKEIDSRSLSDIMIAIQSLPKNSTAQTGNQVTQNLSEEKTNS